MGDRHWCKHEQIFTVPEDGITKIDVRVKSKYPLVKDFFVDDIRLTRTDEPAPHADMDSCIQDEPLTQYKPVKPRSFLDFFMRQ